MRTRKVVPGAKNHLLVAERKKVSKKADSGEPLTAGQTPR
jgi:hypothetical protein